MRRVLWTTGRGLGILLAGLVAAPLSAQAPLPVPDVMSPVRSKVTLRPGAPRGGDVAQMEILAGPTRRVRYFAPTLSPGEQNTLRDLERAENDAAYAARSSA